MSYPPGPPYPPCPPPDHCQPMPCPPMPYPPCPPMPYPPPDHCQPMPCPPMPYPPMEPCEETVLIHVPEDCSPCPEKDCDDIPENTTLYVFSPQNNIQVDYDQKITFGYSTGSPSMFIDDVDFGNDLFISTEAICCASMMYKVLSSSNGRFMNRGWHNYEIRNGDQVVTYRVYQRTDGPDYPPVPVGGFPSGASTIPSTDKFSKADKSNKITKAEKSNLSSDVRSSLLTDIKNLNVSAPSALKLEVPLSKTAQPVSNVKNELDKSNWKDHHKDRYGSDDESDSKPLSPYNYCHAECWKRRNRNGNDKHLTSCSPVYKCYSPKSECYSPKSECYKSDGYKSDGYKSECYSPKSDGYKSECYSPKSDGYKSDGYKSDGYKSDGYRSDGYDSDRYQNDSQKYDDRRNDGDSQRKDESYEDYCRRYYQQFK
jgi:hypothetical protein